MNTQSNAMPESPFESQHIAPAPIPATRTIYWSVQRELWENRSIYIAPLAAAFIFLFGFLISTVRLRAKMRAALPLDPTQQQKLIEQPYDFVALVIMGTALIVAIFYCLDALHGERRDRSILFWKSLPVSDLTTVLSKASIPLVVLPLIAFAVTVVTQLIMLLLSSVVLLGSGVSVAILWAKLPMFQMSLALFVHLLAGHGIWYAPFYGWLLLVSAWARRAAFLWAALPLVAIGVIEKIAFNTSHFVSMLGNRIVGDPAGGNSLFSPGLWIGLAITAAFLAGAVRLRRYQGPI
jgi:ABC-2 type transport system permease protein